MFREVQRQDPPQNNVEWYVRQSIEQNPGHRRPREKPSGGEPTHTPWEQGTSSFLEIPPEIGENLTGKIWGRHRKRDKCVYRSQTPLRACSLGLLDAVCVHGCFAWGLLFCRQTTALPYRSRHSCSRQDYLLARHEHVCTIVGR